VFAYRIGRYLIAAPVPDALNERARKTRLRAARPNYKTSSPESLTLPAQQALSAGLKVAPIEQKVFVPKLLTSGQNPCG
jgi:hypothetical protein